MSTPSIRLIALSRLIEQIGVRKVEIGLSTPFSTAFVGYCASRKVYIIACALLKTKPPAILYNGWQRTPFCH
jgi:hypothetical protein